MKASYTKEEFISNAGMGIHPVEQMILDAKRQDVKITKLEARKILRIENMCFSNHRLNKRFEILRRAGLNVVEAPMKTGFGIARCIKRMNDGSLRVRVSANWSGGKYGNYANIVHI